MYLVYDFFILFLASYSTCNMIDKTVLLLLCPSSNCTSKNALFIDGLTSLGNVKIASWRRLTHGPANRGLFRVTNGRLTVRRIRHVSMTISESPEPTWPTAS